MEKQINIYAEVLEPEALAQFYSAMAEDFAVAGALMPDSHTGYSLPIGAVVSTKDHIVPAWVGYDIGCGMCAIPTDFEVGVVKENSKEIFDEIYKRIPVGVKTNARPTKSKLNPDQLTKVGQEAFNKRGGFNALGSLGGGNHFIEIGADETDTVWIVIHSGSRGVGHGIASSYMKMAAFNVDKIAQEFDESEKAQNLMRYNSPNYEKVKQKYITKVLGKATAKEGHYALHVDSEDGKGYINDMNWALEFALENRKEMISRVIQSIESVTETRMHQKCWKNLINRNHNHAELREDGLWYHRKGATHAEEGMPGVIPGNMRDGSFIVKGKGNVDSLFSSSHGAGRVLSRKKAKEAVDFEDFKSEMEGIQALVTEGTKDESPFAYKDIFEVMRLQESLVDVVAHVKPLINIKG